MAGLEKKVRLIESDLGAAEDLAEKIGVLRPIAAFHLAAAVTPGLSNQSIIDTNVTGTANLLAALQDQPLTRFVLVGSGFEYGSGGDLHEDAPLRPNNVYGATKAAAHLLAHSLRRSRALPVISVRPFTPYGPWEAPWRLVPFAICNALDGKDIRLTEGRQERDYVYVGDVVDALIRAVAVEARDDLEAINVCSGVPVTIRQMVLDIVSMTASRSTPQFGALPYREGEMWIQSGNPARAREVLAWSATTSLSDGLRKTMEWAKANRQLLESLR
jgi:nucleoside-diphosphate-sugar epimerase